MDLALVEAARSGDEEAFASIARGLADRLFVVAHRILRDASSARPTRRNPISHTSEAGLRAGFVAFRQRLGASPRATRTR
jgi:transposase